VGENASRQTSKRVAAIIRKKGKSVR